MSEKDNNDHLKIYSDRSELVHADGSIEVFHEGIVEEIASDRYKNISKKLEEGYLDDLITECGNNPSQIDALDIDEEYCKVMDSLVASITSEVGRALVGLSVLQFVVKAIEPNQSIRLHKGGRSSYNFSWKNGISMRSLDKKFITPTLRKHNLLRLNADGFMMTRSLAENYPYSSLYKANLRGARAEWLTLVEAIEKKSLDATLAQKYLILRLFDASQEFDSLAQQSLKVLRKTLKSERMGDAGFIAEIVKEHIEESSYAARLMEIAMHSMYQALTKLEILDDYELLPLSQMRSANKKHGNVGDIELSQNGQIVMSWDAKYGKNYLRDEIEELSDKLEKHTEIKVAGFITSDKPTRLEELNERINEIQAEFSIELIIESFEDWVERSYSLVDSKEIDRSELSSAWLIAYTESLALKRPDMAPIDEPSQLWLSDLLRIFNSINI